MAPPRWWSFAAPRKLELDAKRKLELTGSARAADAAARFARDCTQRLNVAAGVACVDVVEHVEGVHAELDRNLFPHRERLGQTHVVGEEFRSAVSVETSISVVVQSGIGEDSGACCHINWIGDVPVCARFAIDIGAWDLLGVELTIKGALTAVRRASVRPMCMILAALGAHPLLVAGFGVLGTFAPHSL